MATPRLRLGLAIDLGSPLRGTGRSAAIAGPDAGLALAERAGRLDAPKVLAARQLAEGAHGAPHGREGSAGRGASRVCSCARRGRTLRVWRRGRGGHRRLRGLRRGARRGTPRAIDLGARPRDRGLGLFDRAWRFVRSLAPCGRRWLASAGRATAPERPWKAREPREREEDPRRRRVAHVESVHQGAARVHRRVSVGSSRAAPARAPSARRGRRPAGPRRLASRAPRAPRTRPPR